MESLLYILFTGLLIGILVSAPMGPVGMLVIQRTRNKGRMAALFTGMGASLSDLIYCLLTGLGLSFVTDFITSNQNILQIIGSGVLIAYGFYLFRCNPSRSLSPSTVAANTYWRDFATGFLFTFSNPLILFFIIGLFARFNFMDTHYRYYHYIIGYISITLGAIGWWFLITFIIDKLRKHINVRSMWIINRVIAVLLILIALIGLITGIKKII